MYSRHHSFDVQFAAEHSIEESIIMHHFSHWIAHNEKLNRNFHEGKTWVYQTHDEIAAHYPYLNKDSVRRTIDKLVEKGFLVKGNFNKTSFDRTIWYSFGIQKISTVRQNCQMENGDLPNPNDLSANSIYDTDAKAHTKQQQQEAAAPEPAVVVFYECTKNIGLTPTEQKILNDFPEEEVKRAIEFSMHSTTKIQTTLIQTIRWALKAKPSFPEKSMRRKIVNMRIWQKWFYSQLIGLFLALHAQFLFTA